MALAIHVFELRFILYIHVWQSQIEFRYYADLISFNYFVEKHGKILFKSKTRVICELANYQPSIG